MKVYLPTCDCEPADKVFKSKEAAAVELLRMTEKHYLNTSKKNIKFVECWITEYEVK